MSVVYTYIRRVLFHRARTRRVQFVFSLRNTIIFCHFLCFYCETPSFFLPLFLLDKMFFSSPFARQRVLSPAIVGLIFFHIFANANHRPTVYKRKPFKVSNQNARTVVKQSAGKDFAESTPRPRPPSLPIQIFWDYGKVTFDCVPL